MPTLSVLKFGWRSTVTTLDMQAFTATLNGIAPMKIKKIIQAIPFIRTGLTDQDLEDNAKRLLGKAHSRT